MTTPNGLAVSGRLIPVSGLTVIPPATAGGPAWARLDPRDFRARKTTWVRQVLVHSVTGDWPQHVVPGSGPGGEAARYADIWRTDPTSSAAQILVDSVGVVTCLADLAYTCAYHAEGSNDWSVGIEMYVTKDGSIRQATVDATAAVTEAICGALGIPFQFHAGAYRNEPLDRMEVIDSGRRRNLGGPDCVGVFGHRDNTSQRGRGDPGDAIYGAVAACGAEGLDYAVKQDLARGEARQRWLNAASSAWAPLAVDGLIGPASLLRAKQLGFVRWRDVPA